MPATRALVGTAVVAIGAMAGTVLSQSGPSTTSCLSALQSFESATEKINKYMNDETIRLQSIADEVAEEELERQRCVAWTYLDAEATKLLTYLETNRRRLVACRDPAWYDEQYARWNQAAGDFRRWLAECEAP